MAITGNTFTKEERLSGKTEIDRLFEEGQSFIAYPIRVVFSKSERKISAEKEGVISILICVPKKKFKRAVKRNRVKRLIKEAYRLNKKTLYEKVSLQSDSYSIAFLYLSDEIKTYKDIESSMQKALNILLEKIQSSSIDEKNIH